jgi:hypothetical protein
MVRRTTKSPALLIRVTRYKTSQHKTNLKNLLSGWIMVQHNALTLSGDGFDPFTSALHTTNMVLNQGISQGLNGIGSTDNDHCS